MTQAAVLVLHVLRRGAPDQGGALDHLALDVLRRLVRRPAGLVRHAAAAGLRGEADRVGVYHGGVHVLRPEAEDLGELHGDSGAAPADVGRALDEAHPAVLVTLATQADGPPLLPQKPMAKPRPRRFPFGGLAPPTGAA